MTLRAYGKMEFKLTFFGGEEETEITEHSFQYKRAERIHYNG